MSIQGLKKSQKVKNATEIFLCWFRTIRAISRGRRNECSSRKNTCATWGSEFEAQNPCNGSGISCTPKILAPKRVKIGGPLGLADFRPAWENSTYRFRATPPWWNRRTIEWYSTPSSCPQLHKQAHTHRHIGMHTLTIQTRVYTQNRCINKSLKVTIQLPLDYQESTGNAPQSRES